MEVRKLRHRPIPPGELRGWQQEKQENQQSASRKRHLVYGSRTVDKVARSELSPVWTLRKSLPCPFGCGVALRSGKYFRNQVAERFQGAP